MRYGLDVVVFKNQDGCFEIFGKCSVQRKDFLWMSRNERYPIFLYGRDLKTTVSELIRVLKSHQERGEFGDEFSLGGVLTAKFPNYSEIFHPFPSGTSRIRIPVSQEEIVAFQQQLCIETAMFLRGK